MMISCRKAVASLTLLGCLHWINGFSFSKTIRHGVGHDNKLDALKALPSESDISNVDCLIRNPGAISRRSAWKKSATILTGGAMGFAGIVASPLPGHAAVGTLPEYGDTNAIIQGITVNVADKSQQDAMVDFLTKSFDFQVLRKRILDGVEDTWLGYGPEQLSIPRDFELPVSSFAKYGGHASVHIRFDSKSLVPLYRPGDATPGTNIAFLQVGVPGYRISEMVKNGGDVLDAYGFVNVIAPCGIPMRGIVGIHPDPIMLVAINCENVQRSKEFYQQLGFVEQEYPYARLSKGTSPFEPEQPKGSAYMAPSPNCMGVLLLPIKKKKKVTPNPVFSSLNIVYTPPSDGNDADVESELIDLSGVVVKFQSATKFATLEKATR